jgi:hypothetical protein
MRADLLSMSRGPSFVWSELHWPESLDEDTCVSLLRQLATDRLVRLVVFEVEATAGAVRYRIGSPEGTADRVAQLVGALIPGIALSPQDSRDEVARAWGVAVSPQDRPLVTSGPLAISRSLLAALTSVRKDERVVLQWLLGAAFGPRSIATRTSSPTQNSLLGSLLGRSSDEADPERRKALQAKHADHRFRAVARLGVTASSDARATAIALSVLGGLRVSETPGVRIGLRRDRPGAVAAVRVPWLWPLRLQPGELVGLLAWPLGDQPLPGVPRDEPRRLGADPRIGGRRRVIAKSNMPGDERELGLGIEDAMFHTAVLGPTGTGKSTVLAGLISQDIAAGRGVVVIDPKGDLVDDILGQIPERRIPDVVVVDPADAEYAAGINPLSTHIRTPELVADTVLATFHGLYESSWGPRTQDILHASLLTLAGREGSTLCALPLLLTNPAARRRFRAGLVDPIALDPFWAWFDNLSEGERGQAIAPVLNKTRPFLLRRQVRAIVGQAEPRFHLDEVFTRRRIVLVSLARKLIGPEAASLLGALVIAELWQATLNRAHVPREQRHPVLVYADEFQTYTRLPTDLADALAQSRGLGVGWVLAHQHLAQLPHDLRAAVLANARSRIIFQLAADDAHAVARTTTGDLTAADFQRLRRHEIYAQLVINGEVSGFVSGKTLPLPLPVSDPREVREASRLRYSRPIAEVEKEVTRLVEGGSEDPGVVGRRPKEQS